MTTTADPSTLFAQETAVFNAHKAELLQAVRGKIIVIQGSQILGTFDTKRQAYDFAYRTLGRSRFMVRPVQEEEEVYYVGGSALEYLDLEEDRAAATPHQS